MHGKIIQLSLGKLQGLVRGQVGAYKQVLLGARWSAQIRNGVTDAGHGLGKCATLAGIPAFDGYRDISSETQSSLQPHIDAIGRRDQIWNRVRVVRWAKI